MFSRRILLASVLCLAAFAGVQADEAAVKALQGKWANDGSDGFDATWTFTGGKLEANVNGNVYKAEFKVDPEAKPHATMDVTITESPSREPVAVYAFDVTSSDISCRSGNSPQHKVWVCHIPPGNPNNPQDICIDWSGVPAHVARFRAPGSNPNQGHDSGCEIGKCGSNPCQ